jgi:hypothetical protein
VADGVSVEVGASVVVTAGELSGVGVQGVAVGVSVAIDALSGAGVDVSVLVAVGELVGVGGHVGVAVTVALAVEVGVSVGVFTGSVGTGRSIVSGAMAAIFVAKL